MNPLSVLIFIHIPRTAGQTLIWILERKYEKDEVYDFNLQIKGKNKDTYEKRIESFNRLSEKQRANIRLLHGHMSYGVHRHLPNQAMYISVLRNPLDRVVSAYYYYLQNPVNWLYEKAKNGSIVPGSFQVLESLFEDDAVPVWRNLINYQTGSLSGMNASEPEALIQAKNNIDRFAVVGLTERFDETLMLMKKTLGWKTFPYYENINVNPKRIKLTDIPKQTLRVIERHNELDCELYEYAKKRFEERVRSELKTTIYTGGGLTQVKKSEVQDSSGNKFQSEDTSDLLANMQMELLIRQNKAEGAKEEIDRLKAEIDKRNEYVLLEQDRANNLKEKLRGRDEAIKTLTGKIDKRNEDVLLEKERADKLKEKLRGRDETIKTLEDKVQTLKGKLEALRKKTPDETNNNSPALDGRR